MTEHTFEVTAVKRLGEQIGYGHLMSLASALWRRELTNKYSEKFAEGAFVPTLKMLVVEDWKENIEKENNLYDSIVKNALGDEDCCMTATNSSGAYIVGKEKPDAEKQPKADTNRIAEAVEITKKYMRK